MYKTSNYQKGLEEVKALNFEEAIRLFKLATKDDNEYITDSYLQLAKTEIAYLQSKLRTVKLSRVERKIYLQNTLDSLETYCNKINKSGNPPNRVLELMALYYELLLDFNTSLKFYQRVLDNYINIVNGSSNFMDNIGSIIVLRMKVADIYNFCMNDINSAILHYELCLSDLLFIHTKKKINSSVHIIENTYKSVIFYKSSYDTESDINKKIELKSLELKNSLILLILLNDYYKKPNSKVSPVIENFVKKFIDEIPTTINETLKSEVKLEATKLLKQFHQLDTMSYIRTVVNRLKSLYVDEYKKLNLNILLKTIDSFNYVNPLRKFQEFFKNFSYDKYVEVNNDWNISPISTYEFDFDVTNISDSDNIMDNYLCCVEECFTEHSVYAKSIYLDNNFNVIQSLIPIDIFLKACEYTTRIMFDDLSSNDKINKLKNSLKNDLQDNQMLGDIILIHSLRITILSFMNLTNLAKEDFQSSYIDNPFYRFKTIFFDIYNDGENRQNSRTIMENVINSMHIVINDKEFEIASKICDDKWGALLIETSK